MLKRYWVSLTSNDAGQSADPSNFTVQFNNQIFSTLTERDRIHVFPYRISLPWTWDTITETSDRFAVTLSGGTVKTIGLPHGSPSSVDDIRSEIDGVFGSELSAQGVTMAWDNYTKRFTISWANAGDLTQIDFSGAASCYRLLGFNKTVYDVTGVNINSLVAPNPPDLTQPISIHVKSNLARRSLGIVNGVLANTNLLCSISTENNTIGSNIVYENDTQAFLHEVEPSINSVSFQICDSDGKQLKVGGAVEIVLGVVVEKDGKVPLSQTIGRIRDPVS